MQNLVEETKAHPLSEGPLSPAGQVLLEDLRLFRVLKQEEFRLPASILLSCLPPVAFLLSQALLFLEPFLPPASPLADQLRRMAAGLQDPKVVSEILRMADPEDERK